MLTPSALYCASCGDRLFRNQSRQLTHDRPTDHPPLPTGDPTNNSVTVGFASGGTPPERIAGVIARLEEERTHLCTDCGAVRVPYLHGMKCHGCAGRIVGPLTVQMLEGFGLAPRS